MHSASQAAGYQRLTQQLKEQSEAQKESEAVLREALKAAEACLEKAQEALKVRLLILLKYCLQRFMSPLSTQHIMPTFAAARNKA